MKVYVKKKHLLYVVRYLISRTFLETAERTRCNVTDSTACAVVTIEFLSLSCLHLFVHEKISVDGGQKISSDFVQEIPRVIAQMLPSLAAYQQRESLSAKDHIFPCRHSDSPPTSAHESWCERCTFWCTMNLHDNVPNSQFFYSAHPSG